MEWDRVIDGGMYWSPSPTLDTVKPAPLDPYRSSAFASVSASKMSGGCIDPRNLGRGSYELYFHSLGSPYVLLDNLEWFSVTQLVGNKDAIGLQVACLATRRAGECWLIGRLLDSFEFHQENRDHVRLASFPVCVLGRRLLSDQTTSDQTRHYQTTSDHVRSNPISPAIDWLIDLTYMLLGTASAHNCAVTGVAEMMCMNVAKIYEQDFVCMFYQCM